MNGAPHDLWGHDFIIVGGAGYIGSHVCNEIHRHGEQPITFDNLSSGHEHAVKWGPLVKIDVRDDEALNKSFAKFPDAKTVIHLASAIEVGFGEKYPAEFYDNSVVGVLTLLKAMRKAGADRLIFFSTCATYGETQNMPLTECELQNPISTYGKTKLAIEHMIQSLHKAYDLNYVTLRKLGNSGAFQNWWEFVDAQSAVIESGGVRYICGWPDQQTLDRLLKSVAQIAGLTTQHMPSGLRCRDFGDYRLYVNYDNVSLVVDDQEIPVADIMLLNKNKNKNKNKNNVLIGQI